MTTAPMEPGTDPSINPGDDPDAPDPITPGQDPDIADPSEPEPAES